MSLEEYKIHKIEIIERRILGLDRFCIVYHTSAGSTESPVTHHNLSKAVKYLANTSAVKSGRITMHKQD